MSGTDRRDALVATLASALGPTEPGREHRVSSAKTLEDLRALVPVRTREEHHDDVESRLGFGVGDDGSEALDAMERAEVVRRWTKRFESRAMPRPRAIAIVGRRETRREDKIVETDLRAFAPDAAFDSIRETEAEQFIARVRASGPDTLVLGSLAIVQWLEAHARRPLERVLPSVQTLFVEHDHDTTLRCRLPRIGLGRLAPVGRLGLPTAEGPSWAFTLALRSTIIELLGEGDPDSVSRGRSQTLPPERACMGQRYELVVSGAAGYLRMRTGITVRVLGFDAMPGRTPPRVAPRVVAMSSPPDDLQLDGVTLPGAWVTAAVRQAFRPEDPALVDARAQPLAGAAGRATAGRTQDVFAGTELAGQARRGARIARPRGFTVLVEVQGQPDTRFADQLARRIDDALRKRSAPYAYLRGRGELLAAKVEVRPEGSARKRRLERIRRLRGGVEQPAVRA